MMSRAILTAVFFLGLTVGTPASLAESDEVKSDREVISAYREKRSDCADLNGQERIQCYAGLASMQPKYKSAKARLKLRTTSTGARWEAIQVSG